MQAAPGGRSLAGKRPRRPRRAIRPARIGGSRLSRLLFWSPNYAPELTGIPPLVTDACEWLAARGHEVEIATALPNYPERRIRPEYRGALYRSEQVAGVGVHRSWLRVRPQESFLDKALYELSFAGFSLPSVVRRLRRADTLVVVIPTLVPAVLAAALARPSRTRLVLWFQDLVLEGALALAPGAGAGRMLETARRAEGWAAGAADRVVVCSPGFGDYLAGLGASRDRIETVYNWVDTAWIAPLPAPAGPRTRFLYSGNLGYSQGFETLVEAARLLAGEVEVEIAGAGNAAADVAELGRAVENVTVHPPVARPDFPALLTAADAHVVLQRRVSAGANLPSKIASYLASGRPVVASLDLGTPAARMLEESGGALLVPPESPAALAGAMRQLHESPGLREELARRGRAFAVERLDKERALERLERALLPPG